jgi:NADPH:quinone reductase-like Zn-dependent oxidoreductase
VGAFAVQFAKRLGAHVITTGLARDVDRAIELGADQVINVETTDFATACDPVDLVADTVGGEAQVRSLGVLKRGGRMVSSVSKPDEKTAAEHGVKAQFFIVDVTRDRLNGIASQLDDMQILVGEVLGLSDVRLAHEMLAGRPHKAGKIVLTIK